MAIPKRVSERIKTGLRTFRKVLEEARDADRSEQDTVTICTDMLAYIFGFDKYEEVTGEYNIRGTYCDLAVKVDGKVQFLIEVKAVGKSLRENHLRQATDYAAKEGIEWVILTNGIEWQAHRMVFEQPVRHEHIFTINMLESQPDLSEMIYALSREGIAKQAIAAYHEQRQALNRYSLAAVILSDTLLNVIRRELRRISPGVRIESDDIKTVLKTELLKRDLFDGDELQTAKRRVRSAAGRKLADRRPTQKSKPVPKQGSNVGVPVAATDTRVHEAAKSGE